MIFSNQNYTEESGMKNNNWENYIENISVKKKNNIEKIK
jgi:hypothetical protein